MLEIIVNNRWVYVLAGGVTVCGVVSKVISNLSLKRMMHAAGNMSKSNHALMRLVRAKFEHACMVSEKVENVLAFVDKYLYEHKILGMRIHTWQRMQTVTAVLCTCLGLLGGFAEYFVNGMSDAVIRVGAYGVGLGILLYLFYLTADESYKLEVTRNYMVDYLENVCLHKYEKAYGKHEKKEEQIQEPVRPQPVKEMPEVLPAPEIQPQVIPEPQEVQDVTPPVRAIVKEREKEKDKEKVQTKDVLIRQILEEFMA